MWDGWEANQRCIHRSLASLEGYCRVFNKSSIRNWGTKQTPCPTLNLKKVASGSCRGMAFEFADDRRPEITRYLANREGQGFSFPELPVQLEGSDRVLALVPVYDGNNMVDDTTPANLALLIRAARGTNGPCLSYVKGIAQKLAELGIEDPVVTELGQILGKTGPVMDKALIAQAKNFIFSDIQREISLADASDRRLGRLFLSLAGVPGGGGNLVAALSLLSYTEYGGRLKNNDFSDGNSRKNFDDFFADLGTGYEQILTQHNVYKIFRCGLAHEYYVKQNCTIAMRSAKPLSAGIGHDGKQFFFVVEKYFRDFAVAFETLCAKLI